MSGVDSTTSDAITSPQRLADLESSGLLDSPVVEALDALTDVARTALGADATAMVTAITADRQIVVSMADADPAREQPDPVPLSDSLCKYVVMTGEPYVDADVAAGAGDPGKWSRLGVGAYAGFPLRGPQGTVLGAVCVVTPHPRAWTPLDLQVMRSLASAAEFVVAMLAMARHERLARLSGAVPLEPLARVQHGLRTPLTSILGFLELLIEGSVGAVTSEQLTALQCCHRNALELREAVDVLAALGA
ncbi:GAF domain-containing protein [Nocardioides zeae]|uniref:GAF domain-containing protein n=1 Tax=Nocardioides zeae TaxID=1457234 RepID=A0ACC6INB7_9ACTN|nr:GAF domain-containing protein [Nocardioides zeae]MDR6173387.1 GAF domain-containing protein [Nocardioides zeae]MDR6212252.1 GAF domain-containing protein [Nocardioides zeae]